MYANFASTGDWMRNSRGDLEKVIDKGVKVLVYAGDAVSVSRLQDTSNPSLLRELTLQICRIIF